MVIVRAVHHREVGQECSKIGHYTLDGAMVMLEREREREREREEEEKRREAGRVNDHISWFKLIT